ncbi:MAG: hypothetical protein GY937_01580 [bacterium]|nr:hypothetical protein [bacterium]
MIVHHEGRWIYLGIPKTASTTLHRFLPQHGGVSHGVQHETRIPEAWSEYRVFISVMNPFRRATALWRMWGKDVAKEAWWTEGFSPELVTDFRAFVDTFFLDPPEPDTRPVMEWSMTRWLEHANLQSEPEVLYSERLGEELLRVGILQHAEDVPVQNKSGNEAWRENYDDALVRDVGAWAARDFERFGYPADLKGAVSIQRSADTKPRPPSGFLARASRWLGGRR